MKKNKQQARRSRRQSGFTLVELMIAIVAGIIVTGAAVAFTVTSIKSNADYVSSTRLVQDLRNSIDFVSDDLRRAGYDQSAMVYVANPSVLAGSAFAPILVDTTAGANCIVYAYDRPNNTPGTIDLGNGEVRAVRRATTGSVGVIEVAESFNAIKPDCSAAGPD
jgi:prepilin-type N-terminal cleavage/methylation domain-containing protein